ncbi:hypothetical protein KDA_05600 [Dictyobacter alpinus]|uniref:Uncharacterized protein n=1 Tax=Dictyobacter alpinus TaxID=2014873 RepID=A0A402B152_9CHLR|nr:SHOCT domain-containing protein [Dictyobacter alpinus]GCE25076.1 hypothetical protein KDA_05600 [Dictyobacter alpinus]
MMWGYGLNWLSMTLMMLGSTIWLMILVVIGWTIIRWLDQRIVVSPARQIAVPSGSVSTAREILGQRYARGEIDAATFEQMSERLDAADNRHQKHWGNVSRPMGEKLFDAS